MRRRELSGAPVSRRFLPLAIGIVVLLGLTALAFVLGRSSRSTAQELAASRPPAPNVITGPVTRSPPQTNLMFRATLHATGEFSVNVASSSDGSLPVISAVGVQLGQVVEPGSVLAAIADSPVILLPGAVPAYSEMSYGSTGVQVRQLQAGLEAVGLSIGSDEPGTYGVGTAAAVARLYGMNGYAAPTEPSQIVARNAQQGHVSGKAQKLAVVPLGNIVFVPTLPARVIEIDHLGSTLAQTGFLAKLGTGVSTLSVTTDANSASLLRVGATGTAISAANGQSFSVRLDSKQTLPSSAGNPQGPRILLAFSPLVEEQASPFIGQNLAIRVPVRGGGSQLVVPQAAVVTSATGESHVVVVANGRQRSVAITPGLSFGGQMVVYPHGSELRAGEQVVIGVRSQ